MIHPEDIDGMFEDDELFEEWMDLVFKGQQEMLDH